MEAVAGVKPSAASSHQQPSDLHAVGLNAAQHVKSVGKEKDTEVSLSVLNLCG